MTLIAGFKANDIPFLIGDLLITSGNLEDYPNVNQYFTKKVHKISDNFVIAWSGNRIAAKLIITDFYKTFLNKKVTKNALEDFWENYEDQGDLETFIIGWIVDERPQFFRLNNQYREEVFYESYGINGSEKAESIFEEFLDENGSFEINKDNVFPLIIDGKEIDKESIVYKWFDASYSILYKTSRFMMDEISWQDNRRNGFGGHYEIIFWDGEKFRYLDPIQYLIYSFTDDERNDKRNWFQFPNFGYRNYGCFSVASTSKMIPNSYHTDHLWIVPHVSSELYKLPDQFPKIPNNYFFNSIICSIQVILKDGTKIDYVGSQIACGNNNEFLEYDEEKDSLSIKLSAIKKTFSERAKEMYINSKEK